MSTGYGWECIRQVCATLLVRAMYLSASVMAVSTKGRYNKCPTFTFTFYLYYYMNTVYSPRISLRANSMHPPFRADQLFRPG